MSLLSRISAPAATDDVARLVTSVLSTLDTTARSTLDPAPLDRAPLDPAPLDPAPLDRAAMAAATGLPASAVRPFVTGLGTSVARAFPLHQGGDTAATPAAAEHDDEVPPLYCPPAVRDDPALGEKVNDQLVAWAEQIGIYPGNLDQVRDANFGRLIMLTHPDTDDPDRLLAAAKCALAEWAVDDHYVDGVADEEAPHLIGERLAVAHAVVDPAQLPARYAPLLEAAIQEDPVLRALRSSLDDLARYATASQVRRLRHELAIMFVAYNQEAGWRTTKRTPAVWEYMVQRHENSFLPCMVLIDAVGGYEVPYHEFADPRVRRVFALAGTASVLVNDLYSMGREQDSGLDFNLPKLIAAEENCSPRAAVARTAEIHDELTRTFEAEAAVLSAAGSPALRRFLAGTWAWLGGGREWHRTSPRYQN